MIRSIFHNPLNVILLATMFISSLPSYPALAGSHNVHREEDDGQEEFTVEVISNTPLDEFPPWEPFILRFSESMQIETSSQPISISPSQEGQHSWNEGNTLLTFKPDENFTPDQNYLISLDPSLEAASGKLFSDLQSWEIHTLPGPSITTRSPEGFWISDRFPIIRLTFDRMMDPNSVVHALRVEPEIDMDFGWGGKDFFIRSLTQLDPDSEYRFTLSQGAMDTHALPLGTTYSWTYKLDPVIKAVTWPTHDNRQSALTIEFNYGIEWDSVLGNLAIEPEITGEWITDENSEAIIKFIPDNSFQSDVLYTIRFNGNLFDLRGSVLSTPDPISFRSPRALLSTNPADGYLGNPPGDITLRFDRAMDEIATQTALSFDPPLEGEYSWEYIEFEDDDQSSDSSGDIQGDTRMGADMIFIPNPDSFTWGTEYTGTLDVSAKDAEGNPILQEPYQWSFQTGKPEGLHEGSFGYWGANIQVLDANGSRSIQYEFSMDQPDVISFRLYPLSITQFADRYTSIPSRSTWRSQSRVNLEGIAEVEHWVVEDPTLERGIGEFILPDDVDPGLYVLNLLDGEFDYVVDQLLLVLTKNTLLVKEADGQIVTWVTDINGEVKPGVLVQILDQSGHVVDSGYTDVIGVYRSRFSKSITPSLVMAVDGSDISTSGLNPDWTGLASYGGRHVDNRDSQGYGIYIYTDRPIYRPGQTIFFKGIIRQDDDATLSLPYAGTPVTVRIRDPRNNLVQTLELATNAFGTVNGEFSIAEGTTLGEYSTEMEALGVVVQQIFKVQDYQKPDIQLHVMTDSNQYIKGDEISVNVNANYFFGEPVEDANVSLSMYDLVPENWWWWSDEVENDRYIWTEGHTLVEEGKTDGNGQFKYSILASMDHNGQRLSYWSTLEERIIAIEATVDDGSGQYLSSYKIVKIFSADEVLSLDIGGYFKRPGQSFQISAQANSISNTPLASHELQLEVTRYNHETHMYDDPILHMALETDAAGIATEVITLEDTGSHLIQLTGKDTGGREVTSKRWIYVFEEGKSWISDLSKEIRILSDRSIYAPGDTAHLVIESSFDGPALLTVERGTTRRVRHLSLSSPVTYLDLSILPDDSPNIFVTINAWKEQSITVEEMLSVNEYGDFYSLTDSLLYQDTVELQVPPDEKELTITITPNKEVYAPRQEATFSLEVIDQSGNPVSAELSLALVDEAIFSLSEDLSASMLDAFYAPRQNAVKTFNSMGPRRWLFAVGRGGGGGGGPGLPGSPRSDFPDTAVWIPTLQTDANGRAEITISLPDSLTTWRLTAKAITKNTEVGETEIKILTKQDVVIRPLIPRILTEGDEIVLTAIIQNYSDKEREFDVLLLNTFFDLLDPAMQSLTIKPGKRETAYWRVRTIAPGQATITMIADDGDIGDAVKVSIPIQGLSIPDLTTQVGDFQGKFSTTIQMPEDNLLRNWVQIDLNRSIAGSLLTGLEYLTKFPYGCVEQTMSRALPNAMVARAFYRLGVGTPPELADLQEKINAGVQRLYGYQHQDGGWGWWYDDASEAYQTAWVVYGLAMTLEAGYEVDPNVIKRGADWLSEHLAEMDARMKAYALYSMAIAGYGDGDETLAMVPEAQNLDTFSIAALALAFHELEDHENALMMVNILERTAVVDEDDVYWSRSDQKNDFDRRTMSSTIRNTALALSALVKITPDHTYESKIVRWLMDQRDSQGWGDTHQTSYAILALTDHLLASGYATETTDYAVLFNGSEVAAGTLGFKESSVRIKITGEQLIPGENNLQINQGGPGQLYYVINSWMHTTEAEIKEAGNITIKRRYLDPSSSRPLGAFEVGQLVKVELEVTLHENGSFIILEDKLPGGIEALNESLNITSHELNAWGEPRYSWINRGYNNKEVYGDHVSFFFTELSKGTHTIAYMARVKYIGEFITMPSQAWAMYDNTVWGRSSSLVMRVEE